MAVISVLSKREEFDRLAKGVLDGINKNDPESGLDRWRDTRTCPQAVTKFDDFRFADHPRIGMVVIAEFLGTYFPSLGAELNCRESSIELGTELGAAG